MKRAEPTVRGATWSRSVAQTSSDPTLGTCYTINLLAVPAMVFAGKWPIAAVFILLERIGRAIRKPTVEAMLSYITAKHGKGWVYGVNTALDETGATLGPLLIALVLFLSYRTGYALLLISSVLALVSLVVARKNYPTPTGQEEDKTARSGGYSRSYWLFMIAGTCFAAGMMSYELLAFPKQRASIPHGPQWAAREFPLTRSAVCLALAFEGVPCPFAAAADRRNPA